MLALLSWWARGADRVRQRHILLSLLLLCVLIVWCPTFCSFSWRIRNHLSPFTRMHSCSLHLAQRVVMATISWKCL